MSRRAWLYIGSILITGLALAVLSLMAQPLPPDQLPILLILITLATFSQLFKVKTANHQLYYATMVFLFAAVVLLHPFFFVLVALVPHLVEWAKERWVSGGRHLRSWYLQPFNIAMHVISGLVAQWLFQSLNTTAPEVTLVSVGAGLAAIFCYVFLNHAIFGQALYLARGVSWQESGVLAIANIVTDIIQLCLGYIVAVLWNVNPILMVPALTPLVLMYKALTVPQLQQEARTDTKTGLWNARHFGELFNIELERAGRFQRPLSLIVADLDLLRNINNTYGHLAGDIVLEGVGHIIAETVREYDIPGRFGGEEFIVALPETGMDEAFAVAERLRLAVEAASFTVKTSLAPIHVTMSLGIAGFPEHAVTGNDLIHEADVAVYQAKLQGRNRSICATHEGRDQWEEPERIERLSAPYTGGFIARPESLTGLSVPDVDAIADEVEVDEENDGPPPPPPATLDESVEAAPPDVQAAPQPRLMIVPSAPLAAVREPALAVPAPTLERHPVPPPAPEQRSRFLDVRVYVAGIIALGALATGLGFALGGAVNWHILLLLAVLAMTAELLQLDLYSESNGDKTISISVALNFAAALLVGIPGAAAVSAAISFLHWYRRRPPAYKSVFNWAMHTLAGVVPALVIALMDRPVSVPNLPILSIPVFLAAVAYYGIDTALLTGAISLTERSAFLPIWNKHFRWLAHHYLVLCVLALFLSGAYTTLGLLGAFVFALPVVTMRYAQQQYVDRTKENIAELERMNRELSEANDEVGAANFAIGQLNDELFATVAHILDARDPFVSGHAAKVADYATSLAIELGLPDDQIALARQGGLLHDIGKIGIKESVLYKPSRLTDEEFEHIKTHTTMGAELLETSRSLRHLSPFVRHHHERWDGNGYPTGLAADETPLIARILAVADAVEAMASDRPYHRGMPLTEIVVEVKRCSGTHFDPAVAEAFVRIIERDGDDLVVNSAREVAARQGHLNGKESSFKTGSGWYIQVSGGAPSTAA